MKMLCVLTLPQTELLAVLIHEGQAKHALPHAGSALSSGKQITLELGLKRAWPEEGDCFVLAEFIDC